MGNRFYILGEGMVRYGGYCTVGKGREGGRVLYGRVWVRGSTVR